MCVYKREVGGGRGRPDRVVPCSDACLRFQGFCFMQDQANAIWLTDGAEVCVWVCLKMWGLTNTWLPWVMCWYDKRWQQLWNLGSIWRHTKQPAIKQRLNCKTQTKEITSPLWWWTVCLSSQAYGYLSSLICDGVMEMETESGSWIGTCQRWHRCSGWYWWPADSL